MKQGGGEGEFAAPLPPSAGRASNRAALRHPTLYPFSRGFVKTLSPHHPSPRSTGDWSKTLGVRGSDSWEFVFLRGIFSQHPPVSLLHI